MRQPPIPDRQCRLPCTGHPASHRPPDWDRCRNPSVGRRWLEGSSFSGRRQTGSSRSLPARLARMSSSSSSSGSSAENEFCVFAPVCTQQDRKLPVLHDGLVIVSFKGLQDCLRTPVDSRLLDLMATYQMSLMSQGCNVCNPLAVQIQ